MKNVICIALALVLINVQISYCYNDKEFGYSIKFPSGWKVERINAFGNDGMQATSINGAQMVIGATRQDSSHTEFTNETAKSFTYNFTYPMAKQICDRVTVINAMAVTVLDKYDGIANNLACDDQRMQTMYFVNNGITYTIFTVYNQADRKGIQSIFKSLKTFKIN